MNPTRGRVLAPHRIVIYGKPGVGKTSWACGVEHPSTRARDDVLVLDYESGTNELDVLRERGAETWERTLSLVDEACRSKGYWKTIVIDTIDRLEDQATAEVCRVGKKSSLADFSYGDGFEALAARWRELLQRLEGARAHGRSVVLVAHVQQKLQDDPTLGKYDRYIPALAKRSWGATNRWADAVLFAAPEMGLDANGRAITTGKRLLHTEEGTGYEAKNRWGLPRSMPLSPNEFHSELSRLQRTADEVRASIRSMATGDLLTKAEGFMALDGDDVRRLCVTERALQKKLAETVVKTAA